MRLLLCPTCQTHRISTGGLQAAPCPHCGDDGPQDTVVSSDKTARNMLLGLLVGSAVMGSAGVSCANPDASPSPEVVGTGTPIPEVTGTAAPSPEVTGTAAPTPTP